MTWKCNVCGDPFTSRIDAALCHPDVVEVDDGVSQTRAAEQRNEAAATAQKCPNCNGEGKGMKDESTFWICCICDGTGISKSA